MILARSGGEEEVDGKRGREESEYNRSVAMCWRKCGTPFLNRGRRGYERERMGTKRHGSVEYMEMNYRDIAA